MSSKYHWTQELTNPQDRFRLYQHPTLCTTVRLGWNSRPHDSACEMFVLCVWTVTGAL